MQGRSLGIKIAGDGEQAPLLRERIKTLGLEGRVELLGAISDAELISHYARCRAVYFAPENEDYGFVTLEAFRSGKAVITATDSGGPAELVEDGVNGFVRAPTPEAIAGALTQPAKANTARRLGARIMNATAFWRVIGAPVES